MTYYIYIIMTYIHIYIYTLILYYNDLINPYGNGLMTIPQGLS